MRQYHDLLRHILATGTRKTDRTGTGTVSVFGPQMRFNLAEGFPLVTTKKVHLKSIIHELLWFLRGDTNNYPLEAKGVKIWREWADPETGDLGNVYGAQWRRWEAPSDEVVAVAIRPKEASDTFAYATPLLEADAANVLGEYVTKQGEKFVVHHKVRGGKNAVYLLQFATTGSLVEASLPNIKAGEVKDPYAANVCGVGCIGKPGAHEPRLYNLWRNMLARCYDQAHPQYGFYGGKGTTVSTQWKCFECFQREITEVPYYNSWKLAHKQFELDKDYFAANQYAKSTTIFLDKDYNRQLGQFARAFSFGGKLYVSPKECAEQNGLDRRRISDILLGISAAAMRYASLQNAQPPSGFVYRKQRVIDQISQIIHQLRTQPDSRRMVVSAWNVADLPKMHLPACHALFQFYVADGKLSCQLYQRSADVFLGVPFNIASYALLTLMVAQVTGLQPGEFIWTGGDTHLYANHLEQAELQLTREIRPLPTMRINPAVTDIFGFRYEDFELVNYEPWPAIKAPVAV